MKLRAKHYLIGATSSWLISTSVFAFVAPERIESDKSGAALTLGQRVLRPQTFLDQTPSYDKDASSLSVRRDSVSNGVRLLTGDFAMPSLAGQNQAEGYIAQARQYVSNHPEVFGVSSGDLDLVEEATLIDQDVAFVRFHVKRDGIRIADASIDFRFKLGHLVQVVNHSYSEAVVRSQAELSDLDERVSNATGASKLGSPERLFRVASTAKGYELVKVQSYALESELGSLTAQIDTASGELFEVRDNHYHYDVSVRGETHARWYNEPLESQPLQNIRVDTDEGPVYPSFDTGLEGLELVAAPKLDGLSGRFVRIEVRTGEPILQDALLVNDTWQIEVKKSGNTSPWLDKDIAQLMIYRHTDAINQRAKKYVNHAWLNQPLLANANLPRSCNAHWDNYSINLYSGNGSCANTGLIADVIYHEWGHGLDAKTGGIDDGAFSEGYGDILSLVMTHSNVLGIGFKLSDHSPVRDLEPDRVYPDHRGEVHSEGLIIGSTFWDLFKELKTRHGEEQAGELLATYAFKMIFTARTYLDVYNALLVIDDNDADLANGTPNLCLINKAFHAHGLAEEDASCKLASLDAYKIEDDDSDGVIEPGESIALFLRARNAAATTLEGLTGELRLTTQDSGVEVESASLAWDSIPSQSTQFSSTPAQLRVASDAVCGASFTADVQLAAGKRKAVISKSFIIGKNAGTAEALAATDLPVPVLDHQTSTSSIEVKSSQWDETTAVDSAHLKFNVDHTYVGDLVVSLVSPSGKKVEVVRGKGSSDNLSFDADVTALVKGEKGKGTWQLAVYDKTRRDEGEITAFDLSLTPARFVCD